MSLVLAALHEFSHGSLFWQMWALLNWSLSCSEHRLTSFGHEVPVGLVLLHPVVVPPRGASLCFSSSLSLSSNLAHHHWTVPEGVLPTSSQAHSWEEPSSRVGHSLASSPLKTSRLSQFPSLSVDIIPHHLFSVAPHWWQQIILPLTDSKLHRLGLLISDWRGACTDIQWIFLRNDVFTHCT